MEGVEGRRSGREEGGRVEDGGGVGEVMNMGGGRRRCLELGVGEVVEAALGEQVVMVGGGWRRRGWADGERDEVGVHVWEAALQRSLHCLLLFCNFGWSGENICCRHTHNIYVYVYYPPYTYGIRI